MTSSLFGLALYYILALLGWYIIVTMSLAGIVAVYQESLIWRAKSLPTLSPVGMVKVFAFNVIWMTSVLFGSIGVVAKWILTGGRSNMERDANLGVEYFVAKVLVGVCCGELQVHGAENLPPVGIVPAPVYIANHASQADIASVYSITRQFKWIAKSSTVFLPGVGQIMVLSGHVFIDRNKGKNKKSVSNLFDKCNAAVQAGIPMFFYPQGTRRIATKLPFKDGAFIVAEKNSSLLVPVSVNIPMDVWNSLYPVSLIWTRKRPLITVTIHKPIPASEGKREELKKQCMDQIYSVLPPIYGNESSEKKDE